MTLMRFFFKYIILNLFININKGFSQASKKTLPPKKTLSKHCPKKDSALIFLFLADLHSCKVPAFSSYNQSSSI